MIHNDGGLHVIREPVKQYVVRVELDVEVSGQMNETRAKELAEAFIADELGAYAGYVYGRSVIKMLGRPKATGATLAPE